jgi:hypothetical protein
VKIVRSDKTACALCKQVVQHDADGKPYATHVRGRRHSEALLESQRRKAYRTPSKEVT